MTRYTDASLESLARDPEFLVSTLASELIDLRRMARSMVQAFYGHEPNVEVAAYELHEYLHIDEGK